MRKLSLLLLFLALLALGLFLLFWIDQRARAPVVVPPAPAPTPPAPSDPSPGFQLGGRFQYTQYDDETKRPALRVESDDTRSEGAFDVFEGVVVEVLDPAELGRVRLRLRAARARPRRLEPGDDLQPRWEERMDLEGVRAEVLSGTPLAPIVFETAVAHIDLSDPRARRLTGEADFAARSEQLDLIGRGFDWDLDQERLVIPSGGRVELLRPGAGPESAPATLTTTDGALEMRRGPGAEGVVTLEGREGAVLEPGAASPGRLSARHVLLTARPAKGPTEPLALERLEAEGSVDWTSGEARFQGERLTASFAAEGRLERARLDGAPSAELTLELDPAVLPAGGESEPRRVLLEGQDAIDVLWKDDGYELHVESRASAPGAEARVPTITTSDFRLRSAGSIDGWLAADQRSARFAASGGVIVTSGEATLETARFELTIGPDSSGETVLLGTASGGARLEGRLPVEPGDARPPRSFTVTSPEGLTLERSTRGWRVVEGTRVELVLDEPGGFRARAERLQDFVVPRTGTGELAPEALGFLARGDVRVEFEGGELTGEELEVRGVKPVPHFVLRGTPEAKASFRGEAGEASALEIERTGDTLHARGEVKGSAELGRARDQATRVSFSGDELTLDRDESAELLPGERLRTVRVRVEGNVQGTVVADQQTLVFRCARFSGENRARVLASGAPPVELGSLFLAEGRVHADFVDAENDLGIDCERFEVERMAGDVENGFRQLTASGDVRFQGRFGAGEEADVAGECEVFELDADRRGSLAAGPSGRVALIGRVPKRETPFRLVADHIDFEAAVDGTLRLLALRPELRMLGLRARAEHFTADDQQGVVLSGDARVSGATSAHVPFTLAAEEIVLVGRRAGAARGPEEERLADEAPEDQIDSLTARGAVDFQLSDSLRGRGERLSVRRSTGLLRLEGTPASFELGGSRFETEWVEFDPVLQLLVGTGRGRMFTAPETADEARDWTLEFLSVSSLLEPDSVVLVVQEPLFASPASRSSLRATWGILWLNRDALEDLDRRGELLDGLRDTLARLRAVPEGAALADVLALFRSTELSGLLREVYFEGPVEVLAEGDLLARADAIYLDAASQHGWLSHATVNLGRQFIGQRQEKLIIKTDWLRVSSDATLKADRATVTSCAFDEPHVQVVTGDLTIRPTLQQGKTQYELVLQDNGIELYDFLRIPLPTIDVATDEDFKPLWPTLSLANSARFGTLFSFAFTRPADRVGRVFDRVVRSIFGSQRRSGGEAAPAPAAEGVPTAAAPPPSTRRRADLDANWNVDGSYLGSRGGLLDVGLEIEAKDRYWFDLYLGVVYDTGEDRGFIRVDEDERDTLRTWLRSQAYFEKGKSAWSFSLTDESDAAVQSEFFEGRFLRYERSENYVQWRRSNDENFAQASVKLRLDEFRTDVEELPSVSAYRGRSPLLRLGGYTLLHTGDARAEYLRRRQGTEPHSPFGLPSDFGDSDPDLFGDLDGLGEREILRFDTRQGLELPVPLGNGIKLTPFAGLRATAWSEGVDEGDSPERFVAEAGARLGGSFWRRGGRSKIHQLAPFVEYRNEIGRTENDGEPVEIDQVERFVSADVVRVGARTRLGVDQEGSTVDLDLVGAYASGRSDGAQDGWLPLEVFLRFLIEPLGHQFTIFHEGRFDFEERQTDYSVISVGTHLGQQWGVQLSHQRGRDNNSEPLFEAASVAALYRWTEKWEFEGRQSFSLLENERLDTKVVLRRYAHDLVMEIETSVREGEGSSFGLSVKPRFGYDPPRVGYVPW